MKVIIVDDEQLAITTIQRLLQSNGIEVIGAYQNPFIAMDAIERDKPDLVFLDIEMPEMNGLQVAKYVNYTTPSSQIVFVSAYNDYALSAFEVHALDYLLKPICRERLNKTLQRFSKACVKGNH